VHRHCSLGAVPKFTSSASGTAIARKAASSKFSSKQEICPKQKKRR
jgi:hypothetical protein